VKDLRVGPDVDHGVDVVGGSHWELAALGAVEVHQLSTDQGPARVEVLVQVEDSVPGSGLL